MPTTPQPDETVAFDLDTYRTRVQRIIGRDTEEALWDLAIAAGTAARDRQQADTTIVELRRQLDELAGAATSTAD